MRTLQFFTVILVLIISTAANAEAVKTKILLILTNTAVVPQNGQATGVWVNEYVEPFEIFTKAGYDVEVASPKGGLAPLDPKSGTVADFKLIPEALKKMQNTVPLSGLMAQDYAAVFLVGGNGTLWDFPNEANVSRIVSYAISLNRLVGAVCHGPAGLIGATADGKPLVQGRKLTGYSNAEEEAGGMTKLVPFLLQDKLIAMGAKYDSAAQFRPLIVQDGNLITGQNPASAAPVAMRILDLLKK